MKRRSPQLALRLDPPTATDIAGSRWRDGAALAYLGGAVILQLDTAPREALLDGLHLHLPLPPEATPRQIQDAAESWLRAQADRVIGATVVMEARRLGHEAPAWSLSFAARGHWAQEDDKGGLRFHWRLIEQSPEVIAQVVARAVSRLAPRTVIADLFALSL